MASKIRPQLLPCSHFHEYFLAFQRPAQSKMPQGVCYPLRQLLQDYWAVCRWAWVPDRLAAERHTLPCLNCNVIIKQAIEVIKIIQGVGYRSMMQDCHNILNILSIGEYFMNFLNFITSGASLLNFNLQNITSGFGFNPPQPHPVDQKTDSKEANVKSVSVLPPKESTEEVKNGPGKESEVELFTKQQQLINQYMHLNIQLLSKKLQSLENVEKQPKNDEQEHQNEPRSAKKKIKKTNSCGHSDREHYAKGMCSNCYHKFGRNKKPWNCQHDKLYANGMCQNCYINSYNRKRREERAEERNDGSEAALKIEEEQ